MKLLTGTNRGLLNTSLLLLRCTVGLILFVAGAGKIFGWFGGMGIETTISMFVNQSHIPAFWAYVSCYTELIGGILLAIGLLTRPVAFAILINMVVATIVAAPMGFFTMAGYPFSLAVSALIILLAGPLDYSLDAVLAKKKTA